MGNENGRTLSAEELRNREIQVMDSEMAHRLRKGNTYNLKVVIKGDRNTGKTCLFNILQRRPFIESYVPTNEIQVATINWEYKASYDVVKVEVWDVVDRAKRKGARPGGLKLTEDEEDEPEEMQAPPAAAVSPGSHSVSGRDSKTVNVMRGAHAVIITVDPTKKWTFEYAQRELPKIPSSVAVLLLANYKDLEKRWVVTPFEMRGLVETCGSHVRYLEVSLLNSFGLKGVQLFFNMPFLRMKHALLEQQLRKSQEEIELANQELDYVFQESNYDNESRKNQVPTAAPTPQQPAPTSAKPAASSGKPAAAPAASPKAAPTAAKPPQTPPAPAAAKPAPAPAAAARADLSSSRPPSTATAKPSPSLTPAASTPRAPEPSGGGVGGFFSRMFGSDTPAPQPAAKPAAPQRDVIGELKQIAKKRADGSNIDDFRPEIGTVDDFLGPDDGTPAAAVRPAKEESSSEEEEDGNPIIAKDEDLDGPASQQSAISVTLKSSSKPSPGPPSASTPQQPPTPPPPVSPPSPASPKVTMPASLAPSSPPAVVAARPVSPPKPQPPVARASSAPSPSLAPSPPIASPPSSVSLPHPAPAVAVPARAPPPPPPSIAEPESDEDDGKPNPFIMQDEEVGDDGLAVQKAPVGEMPKPAVKKEVQTPWRSAFTEPKPPAPKPAPAVAIDVSALMAEFLKDDEPAAGPSGFESIPDEASSAPRKPKKKKAAAGAETKKKKGAPKKKPIASEESTQD